MDMRFRGLLAAAVVLLVLAGLLLWSNHRKPSGNTSSTNSTPAVVTVKPADVTGLTIKAKGAEPVVLSKSGSRWQITAPTPAAADSDAVTSLLGTLSPPRSQ